MSTISTMPFISAMPALHRNPCVPPFQSFKPFQFSSTATLRSAASSNSSSYTSGSSLFSTPSPHPSANLSSSSTSSSTSSLSKSKLSSISASASTSAAASKSSLSRPKQPRKHRSSRPIFKNVICSTTGIRNAFAWHPKTRTFTTYTHSFKSHSFTNTLKSFLGLISADVSSSVTRHTWNWLFRVLPRQSHKNGIISHQRQQSPPSSAIARHNYIFAILWDLEDEFASAVVNYPYEARDAKAYETIVQMWIQAQFQKVIDARNTSSSRSSPSAVNSYSNIYADVMDRIEDLQEFAPIPGQPWTDGMEYLPTSKAASVIVNYCSSNNGSKSGSKAGSKAESKTGSSDDGASAFSAFSAFSLSSASSVSFAPRTQPVLANWLDCLEEMAECDGCGLSVSNVLDILSDYQFMQSLPQDQWESVYDLLTLLILSRPREDDFLSEYLWPAQAIQHFYRLRARVDILHRSFCGFVGCGGNLGRGSGITRLHVLWAALK